MIAFLALFALLMQETDSEPLSQTREHLRAQVDATWAVPRFGHPYPIRIELENLGPARAVLCEVTDLSRNHSTTWTVRRRLRLDERERVQFSLLVPATEGGSHYLSITVEGVSDPVFSNYFSPGSTEGATHFVVDARRDIMQTVLERAFGIHPSRYRGGTFLLSTHLSPDRLSDLWQAYEGIAGVWIRDADWPSLPAPVRQAILRAVKAGQTLVLYAAPKPEEIAQRLDVATSAWLSKTPFAATMRLGTGTIMGTSEDITTATDLPNRLPPSSPLTIPHREIPGIGRVSFSLFMWIILLFAILIGPINLLVVSRLGNRLLFFLTTPVLAFLAVASLFGYSMIRDGFGIKAAVVSLTRLNAEEHEAITEASLTVYSGLASGTWRCSPESLWMAPTPAQDSPSHIYYSRPKRSSATQRSIAQDWSRSQELSGGWVPARQTTQLSTVQIGPHRARLAVEMHGTDVIVHNSLGTRIENGLLFRKDVWYSIPSIADGGKATLNLTSERTFDPALPLTLRPGEFAVRLTTNPFLETGERRLLESNSLHLVTGPALEYK